MLITLVSCGKKTAPVSEHISQTAIPLSAITLNYAPTSLCAFKNIAFAIYDNKIIRYDVTDGSEEVIVAITDGSELLAVGCNSYYVAAVSDVYIYVYDYDGHTVALYPHSMSNITVSDVAVSSDYVAFGCTSRDIYGICVYDIDEMKISVIPSDEWKADEDAIPRRIDLSEDGDMYINMDHNLGPYGGSNTVCEYRIKSGKVRYSAETDVISPNGCFDSEGNFYALDSYLNDDSEFLQFISEFDRDELVFSDIALVDNDALYEKGITPVDVEILDRPEIGLYDRTIVYDDYYLEYADGDNFTIYNETANVIISFTRDTSLEPLIVLMPDSNYVHNFRSWAAEYMVQTGRQMIIQTYPAEKYIDNMYTKLMAEDSDFDVFFADESLLSSVIGSSMHVPLDSYEGIVYNFDNVYTEGVKEFMSTDDGIFGVPLQISFSGPLEIFDDSCTLPEMPTIDDIFALCDSLEGSGKKAFTMRTLLFKTVRNIVEEMIYQDGAIDEEVLAGYLERLKGYNDAGVLCDGEGEGIIGWGMIPFDFINLKIGNLEGRRIIASPTVGETKYMALSATAIINPASQNIDAAAELLELLSSEYVVYDNINYGLIIGKDPEKNPDYASLTDLQKGYVELVLSLYEHSKPERLGAIDDMTEFVNETVADLFDGKISSEKAADKIASKVTHAILE